MKKNSRNNSYMIILFSYLLINSLIIAENNNFKKIELEYNGKYDSYIVEDLNGDNLNDILLLTTNKQNQFFSIYYQKITGFDKTPQQKIKISKRAILFDVANIDSSKNKEIVFLTKKGVYYYEFRNNKYSNKLLKLLRVNTIFMQENYDNLEKYDFLKDLDNDNIPEILVQHFNGLSIYKKNSVGKYELKTRLNINCIPQKQISFALTPSVIASYYAPKVLFDDYNNDGKKDIIIVNPQGLSVYFQDSANNFSNSNLMDINIKFGYNNKINVISVGNNGTSNKEGITYIGDLNNDGILDIITEKLMLDRGVFNPKKQIRIFFGEKSIKRGITNYHYPIIPNQIIINEGFQAGIEIVDINNDNKKELIIPIVELGILKIIKMFIVGYVNMDVHFYGLDNSNMYVEDEKLKMETSVKMSKSGEASASVFDIKNDFSGDGVNDLLISDRNILKIFYNNNNGSFNDEPDFSFEMKDDIDSKNVKVTNINSDNKSDIIITEYKENNSNVKSSLLLLISN